VAVLAVMCKNEEAVLQETHSRLVSVLQHLAADFEIIYIDDGSADSAFGIALILILYAISVHVFTNRWVTGWTSLFFAIPFVGGAQLVCLGIMGEYIGRIYGEAKRCPVYLVQERWALVRRRRLNRRQPRPDGTSLDQQETNALAPSGRACTITHVEKSPRGAGVAAPRVSNAGICHNGRIALCGVSNYPDDRGDH